MSALDRVTAQWNNIHGTSLIKQLCVMKTKPVLTMDRKGERFQYTQSLHIQH